VKSIDPGPLDHTNSESDSTVITGWDSCFVERQWLVQLRNPEGRPHCFALLDMNRGFRAYESADRDAKVSFSSTEMETSIALSPMKLECPTGSRFQAGAWLTLAQNPVQKQQ
jgi:hypothetical protein